MRLICWPIQLGSVEARAAYHAWVTQMQEQKSRVGALSSAIDHFVPRHGELRFRAVPLL